MLTANNISKDYMEEWPLHYYEIEDISEREHALTAFLAQHPDSLDDQKRLVLLHKRFGDHTANRGDRFMAAWMMIQISGNSSVHFLNRKRMEKELRKNLQALCILDFEKDDILVQEWYDFARRFLYSCTSCKSYGSTLCGMFPLKDKTVAAKIASEIDHVTRIIPLTFGLAKECEPFRQIVVDTYIKTIENGQSFWDDYCQSV
ncbi:MAG: hypothetical protein KA965_07705 [Butyrivibrio sp.]|nr:hypothetical protein [Butyrivibrio sp.]